MSSTGCQYSGHWLFTQLLLPALFSATDTSSTHEKARIVTVSSSANYLTTGIDFDAIADGPGRTKYGEWELYNKSKFVRRIKILPTLLLTGLVPG
jgi:retinol dehydrogenase 12